MSSTWSNMSHDAIKSLIQFTLKEDLHSAQQEALAFIERQKERAPCSTDASDATATSAR
jgi:hypothetical protein